MTASSLWLGLQRIGLAAARLLVPDVDSSNFALFYATDTGVLSLYNGSAWVNIGSGSGINSVVRNANVAATGSALADAAQLASGFTVVTAADGTKGVKLPATPAAGTVAIVKNHDSENAILKIWPDAAATINAIAANGAISIAAKTSVILIADSTTQWYTIPLLPS